jgi:hypothetical protein
MADDVTLKIKVKDEEVNRGEASLKRLKKAADDVGTSKAPGANIENSVPKATSVINDLTDALKGSAGGFGEVEGAGAAAGTSMIAVAGIAAALVVAFVAVVGIGIKVAQEITHISAEFASYGIEIGKGIDSTGLAAETFSALKHEIESTGGSVGDLNGPLKEFRKTIGEAAAGSEDARRKLGLLGIDGTRAIYNIDSAFRTAVANIVKLPAGLEQARAAYAAFGDEGYKLIPFFQQFHGNVDAAVKKAEELGLVLSGKDVEASKEFTRAYSDLKGAIDGITYTFGREFAPTVTKALNDFNSWLLTNKKDIKDWAVWTGEQIKSIVEWWEKAYTAVKGYLDAAAQANTNKSKYAYSDSYLPSAPPPTAAPIDANKVYGTPTMVPGLPGVPDPEALQAKLRELDEFTKRSLTAQIDYAKNAASNLESSLQRVFDQLKEQFEKSGDAAAFQKNVDAIVNQYIKKIDLIDSILKDVENRKAANDKATPDELSVLQQNQNSRTQQFADKYVDIQKRASDLVEQFQKRSSLENIRTREQEMRKAIELSDETARHLIENRQYEFDQGTITEREYLDFVGAAELKNLQNRKKALEDFLADTQLNAAKRTDIEGEVAKVTAEIDQQVLRNKRALTAEEEHRRDVLKEIAKIERESADPDKTKQRREDRANEEKLDLVRQIQDLKDAISNAGINDSLIIEAEHLKDILDLRNRELDAVIAINRAQLELSPVDEDLGDSDQSRRSRSPRPAADAESVDS